MRRFEGRRFGGDVTELRDRGRDRGRGRRGEMRADLHELRDGGEVIEFNVLRKEGVDAVVALLRAEGPPRGAEHVAQEQLCAVTPPSVT